MIDPMMHPMGPTNLVGPKSALFQQPRPFDPYGYPGLIDPNGMPMPDPLTPGIHPLGLGAPLDPDDEFAPPGYIKPPARFGPPTFGPGAYAPG